MPTRSAPRGKEMRESMKEPLKETEQMEAEAMPPMKSTIQPRYCGFLRMRMSSSREASFTDISSCITYTHPHNQLPSPILPGPRRKGTYLPIKLIRILQLPQIQRRPLPDKLDIARARDRIIERDEHHVGEVHARELDVEHARGGLHLRLETVRRRAEHHERARELEDEFLPLDDLGDVAGDLQMAGV